ncbi:hypothetical protein SUDANB145_07251 (plasmid) [Streptomyces sp. enrichment culture]|uniref:hypothetical protein n=1 Tax=Streptomyces sp. enrichment culture TaxID=1795815 RepID=UPI003F54B8D6
MPDQPALFDTGLVEPPPAPETPRTYWENRGPHDWQPVQVICRYGPTRGVPSAFPDVVTKPAGPRNVQILRTDGTSDVLPVRNLRRHNPEEPRW